MIATDVAIRRPITVITLAIFLAIGGLISYLVLPRESFPDITIPLISVTTTYEGVSPADIENTITIPIEKKLKGISEIEEMRSVSAEGTSTIQVKFSVDVDIDVALQKVKDKVDMAKRDLPKEADEPTVTEINLSEFPIMFVVLSGDVGLVTLKELAEDLSDKLETIPGVLDIQLSGGLEREIRLEVDPDRLAAYDIPITFLKELVQRENLNVSGGGVEMGQNKYLLRVPGEFADPAEVNSLIWVAPNGQPVYLPDVATIVDGFKERLSYARINGKEAVTLGVVKRSGENIIRIADAVKEIVADAKRRWLPPGVEVTITFDQSRDIRIMVADLENSVMSGFLLVVAVIMLAMGARNSLFVGFAIPMSILITFLVLAMARITLNMVVLFALVLAVGMLVDNAIVVVENIYRHRQEGYDRMEAALRGTAEVAWPIITSTLTTQGAFMPLLFWPGMMGKFMWFLPTTVIIALGASLFVALVMNPVFCMLWMKAKPPQGGGRSEGGPGRFMRAYRWLLALALDHRIVTLTVAVYALLACIGIFCWRAGRTGRWIEFFPEVDPSRAFIDIRAPEGTNLSTSDAIARRIESILTGYEDIEFFITDVGSSGGTLFGTGAGGSHLSRISINFKPYEERKRSSLDTLKDIRRALPLIAGAEVLLEKEQHGPPRGAPINVEVSGEDYALLAPLAAKVKRLMREVPGVVDLKDDYVGGRPEMRFTVDRRRAALMGLDTRWVAYVLKTVVNGVEVSKFREGDEEYDITVRLSEKHRNDAARIMQLMINDAEGRPIPLSSVAHAQFAGGLGTIRRIDQKKTITVQSNVAEGYNANAVLSAVQRALATLDLPRGYTISYTGEQEEQSKAERFLWKAFLAALFIIVFILIAQFDSPATPAIIMSTVLLALMGVFLSLALTGRPFGVIMTGLGTISLAGVVVNNGIVLLDYVEKLRARGLELREAMLLAGCTRLRPVLLTAVTTVLGLIPMVAGVSVDFHGVPRLSAGGESVQWWAPMAEAVAVGLVIATALTLIVVPTLYYTIALCRSGRTDHSSQVAGS